MRHEKLSELLDISMGRTPSRNESKYWGEGHKWVSIRDLNSKIITETKEQITDLAIEEARCKVVPRGTLLFSFKLTIGKMAFAGCDLFTNEAIAAFPIKDKRKLNSEFLYYALLSAKFAGSNQAAMGKTLNSKSLADIEIPLPPLDDQNRIAHLLGTVEGLIAQRKENLQQLDELLKSIFLEMFGDTSKFRWDTIGNIADKKKKYSISSGPFGSNLTSKHYANSGVIILRGTNISSGKLKLDDVKYISNEKAIELKRSELQADDVVIIAVGSSGQALKIPKGIPKMVMSQNFNKITPDISMIHPTYLEFCINSQYVQGQFKKQITDTVRTFLSLTKIISISVPVPPIPIQNQFATIVEKVESLKSRYQNSLTELENLYGVLSQKAFKGQLDLARVPLSVEGTTEEMNR